MLLRYNNVLCTCGGGITGWWDIDLLLRGQGGGGVYLKFLSKLILWVFLIEGSNIYLLGPGFLTIFPGRRFSKPNKMF